MKITAVTVVTLTLAMALAFRLEFADNFLGERKVITLEGLRRLQHAWSELIRIEHRKRFVVERTAKVVAELFCR